VNPVPHRAERLMGWSLAPWERAAVLGDLEEEAQAIADSHGEDAARQWYWRQTALSVVPNVARWVRSNLKQRDDLRLMSTLAMSQLPEMLTRHPWTFGWTQRLVFIALAFTPSLYRRWLEPARPMATPAWWVATITLVALLILWSMYRFPFWYLLPVFAFWIQLPSGPVTPDQPPISGIRRTDHA
jgi:hypothetical protein